MSKDKFFKGYNPDFLSRYGSRDWQKDMEMCEEHEYLKKLCSGWGPRIHGQSVAVEETEDILKYWLDRYKETQLDAVAERERADQAEERERKLKEARTIDEWHEDIGDVLWWEFPISEPPYCGTPLDLEWPNYHTHWTPIVVPDKEEDK